ncbi:PorP/SprF family type IX secretion system membrane protein [Marinirhabdus gelatinilytica]|uniref:Type IX secretion system PorP/SprF family membrane protein n=1 Tax=Marinirhabdus gelatinilytica TaxID=1703343 RepID=A0A370QJJ6_9FLAO|nr:type IX secretion system membrane protein PorP/SprF [Marinirhabdus gelatinilytica]RDK88240.1 type IX secretion system PorP/SprF family membrane protein [Marinirhabdus gelatinilytica]
MKKILILTLIAAFFWSQDSQAQQDPQYTQYMYNMNVVNPAYAGSKESLSITALYRKQWSGLDGAPETFTVSGHSPISDKIGLGLSAIKDELGPISETNVYADFSYTLDLGATTKLAFGLKAGVTFHDVGLTSLELQDPGDPFFSQDINNTYPNIGAGAFLYGDNYYIGLSVPNMLNSVHLDENGLKYGNETNHYFATAGYVFQVSDNFKLKPSVLVKSAFDAPLSFDGNLNALFYDMFEIGASYRLDDSFSGLVGFQATDFIRIGYAYDRVISDIEAVASSSHEIILTFDLMFKKRTLRSPRYF